MKNVISFSLWGSKPIYLTGALINNNLAKSIYPGWVCRFYVDRSVPEAVINKLKSEGAEIILKPDSKDMSGMMWRFEAAFDPDVKYFIVRDADSRLTLREKAAVDEWLSSGKSFHIMRDHPNHKHVIMGGMWGGISGYIPNFKDMLESYTKSHDLGFWSDMLFLRDCIWESYVKHDHISHDEYWRPTGFEKKFPKALEDITAFVGNKYDETGIAVYDLIKDDVSSSGRILCTHLGLGDHIICNGLIREKARGVNLYTFAKYHNVTSVMFMFRDLPNVHVIGIPSDAEVKNIIEKYPDSIKILTGMYKSDFLNYPEKSFDEIFYMQAGVNFSCRWGSFYIQRDFDEEQRVKNILSTSGSFIFVHDDHSRGYTIKDLPKDKVIVRPVLGLTHIFGYIGLIAAAEEAHFIDSSFMNLVESLPEIGKNIIFHRSIKVKVTDHFNTPTLKRNWKINI